MIRDSGLLLWGLPCTNGATTLSRMNLSGYVGHVTIFSCVLFSSRLRVSIRFSVWLVNCYACVLLSILIVTLSPYTAVSDAIL